jgi:hypothetical protein
MIYLMYLKTKCSIKYVLESINDETGEFRTSGYLGYYITKTLVACRSSVLLFMQGDYYLGYRIQEMHAEHFWGNL